MRTVAWYRLRATLRRPARYVSIVVLVGLLGGVAMAALAGARRTQSAFARVLRADNASDITVTWYGVLAVGVGAGAVTALGLTLSASVRRRRRDLALLKTLGFTRRELMETVAWQASAAAAAGVVIGLPLGIAAGRWLWTLFAREIAAVPQPAVPAAWVLVAAIATLALANAAASIPARNAARTSAAAVLKAE